MPLYGRRYVLHERLGAGGMGEVYRATDRLAGQDVALKRMLLPHGVLDPDASVAQRVALATEFQTLASLRHPNIISVIDYGFDIDGQPYFTMTLLEHRLSLVDHAAGLSVPARMTLVVEILRALAYLHRRGIVHRDLKPSNVLVPNGQVKVLDFGLSSGRGSTPGVAGTLAYMAPEVLRGAGASEASDLYAIGVIAYELVSGKLPFRGADTQDLANRILRDAPDLSILRRWSPAEGAIESPPDAVTGEGVLAGDDARTMTGPLDLDATASQAASAGAAHDGLATGVTQAPRPHDLGDIIARLLQKRAGDRYRDASLVIYDLSAVLGQPLPAETRDTRESFLQAAPIIGREREREHLISALAAACRGEGRVLLIGGESGIGKSRLLDELRTAALVQGAIVARGQAVSEGGEPYEVWREPLRQRCLLGDVSDAHAAVLKPLVADVEALLGRRIDEAPAVSAEARQERLLSVMEDLFASLDQPFVVLLEDLHWAGDGVAVLRRLVRAAALAPLLIVGTYRHEEAPALPDSVGGAEVISLDRLSLDAVAALAESMLGQLPNRARIADYLHRETEGNAFFLVEVVRALAEEAGQLDHVAMMALPQHVLSGGMQRLITLRLDRVPAGARPRLHLAAVLGRQLDLPAIGAAGSHDLEDWLLVCSGAGIIEVQQDRWRFAHDKFREALLAGLSPDARAELHAQAATGVEAAYPDRDPYAASLAYHWGAAGDVVREAEYSVIAGRRAFAGAAYTEAVRLLARAVALAQADSRVRLDPAATERLLGEALFSSGRMEESRGHLERAVRHLRGIVPPSTPGRIAATLGRQVITQVLHRCQPRFFVGRLREPRARGRALLLSQLYERLGHVHYILGNSMPVLCASLLNVNVGEAAGTSAELARSYATQIVGAGMIGRHGLARKYMALARDAAAEIANPGVSAWVDLMAVTYLVGTGPWAEAEAAFARAAALYEEIGDRRRLQETTIVGGVAQYFSGRFEDCRRHCMRVDEIAIKAEEWQPRAWSLAGAVQALVASGREADALRLIDGHPVLERPWHGLEGIWLHGVLARCRLRSGDVAGARQDASRAVQLMEGTMPTGAFTLEGYAGAAETWVRIWALTTDRAGAATARRHARQSLRALQQFARLFPVGRPRAALCQGLFEAVSGRRRRAEAAFARSAEAAGRLAMPYEIDLASREADRLRAR